MNIFSLKPTKKIAQRQMELRTKLFPHITEAHLWHRKTHHGFTTIPRTLPLIMSILDDIAEMPVGATYLELWCRGFDESFVTLTKPREIAFHSGIGGQRQESTWRQRIKKLTELGFIEVAEGAAGAYSYALILNPYLVIRRLYEAGGSHIPADKYHALLERALEISAHDMDMPDPWAPPPPAPAPVATVPMPPAPTLFNPAVAFATPAAVDALDAMLAAAGPQVAATPAPEVKKA